MATTEQIIEHLPQTERESARTKSVPSAIPMACRTMQTGGQLPTTPTRNRRETDGGINLARER